MKNLCISIAVLLFLFIVTPNLVSQGERIVEKYSKIRISIQDKSDIVDLQRLGFDLEGTKLNEN